MKNPELQDSQSQFDTSNGLNDNLTYEYFIRKCFACKRFQHGANTDTWENLRSSEWLSNLVPPQKKDQKAFEKNFKEVQTFLDKAFEVSFKRLNENNASENDVEQMEVLKKKVAEATNTTDLMNIIRNANKILIDNNITIKR